MVGIDVSAKSLDVVVRQQGNNGQSATYTNSHSGYNQFITKLKKLKPELIVMEATGVYHFAKTLLQRSKTDAIDAGLIA